MFERRSLAAIAALIVVATPAATAVTTTPDGFEQPSAREVASELIHRTLRRSGPDQVVNVVSIERDGPYALRTVLSHDAVSGSPGLERTSSMCKRISCLVAINGDFALPDSGEPVGGLVSLGEPMRSPNGRHHQLVIAPDGSLVSGPMRWSARMVSTDLREITIDGVNVARTTDSVILYTPANGARTATNRHGVEVVLTLKGAADAIRLDNTSVLTVGALGRSGDTKIPRSGAVLSGHGEGAKALADLTRRIRSGQAGPDVLLRIESTPKASESLGGSPVLVRDGRRWFADDRTAFVRGRHPRTIVGWTPGGDALLVTVDGRQPGYAEGMSLAEAADLMIGLGAREAINLDGGGSSTFVVKGTVVNRPSDRLVRRAGADRIVPTTARGEAVKGNVERPVVSALAVVPKHVIELDPAPAPTAGDLDLPQALALTAPLAADPASDPTGSLPAIVATEPDAGGRAVVVLVAALALATVILALGVDRHRTHPRSVQR